MRWMVNYPCSSPPSGRNRPCRQPVPNSSTETIRRFRFPKEFWDSTEVAPRGEMKYHEMDEVEHYKTMRTLTPPEGAAKVLGIPPWTKSCAVVTLPVHCLDQEILYFDEGKAENALENARHSKSVASFQLCAANPSLEMRYADVPSFCRWNLRRHEWIVTSVYTNDIGRLAMAIPGPNSERFYVRQLLLNVTSPKSIEHLRTVDGVFKGNFPRGVYTSRHCRRPNLYKVPTGDGVFCQPSNLGGYLRESWRIASPTRPSHCGTSLNQPLWQIFFTCHSLVVMSK